MCYCLLKKNSRLEHYPYIYVYRALGQPLEIKLPRSTISERIDQIYIFGHLISFPIPNERSLSKSQFQKFPQWPGREREINDLQWDNEKSTKRRGRSDNLFDWLSQIDSSVSCVINWPWGTLATLHSYKFMAPTLVVDTAD